MVPVLATCECALDHVLVLAVWWALWTLADAYLIRFTPVSELFVLAGAASAMLLRARWASASACCADACSGVLTDVTQTAPAPRPGARAYEKQEEGGASVAPF